MNETKESLSAFTEKKGRPEPDKFLSGSLLISPNEIQYDSLLLRLKQQLGEGRGEVILDVSNFYILWYCLFIKLLSEVHNFVEIVVILIFLISCPCITPTFTFVEFFGFLEIGV